MRTVLLVWRWGPPLKWFGLEVSRSSKHTTTCGMLRDVVEFIKKETIQVIFEKETMERLAWEQPKKKSIYYTTTRTYT